MRTGWGSNDTYALLDVGPLGHGHQHQDSLNLVLMPYGRYMLWDGGGGQYQQDIFRTYAIGTFNHNTVVIDNLPQKRDTSTGDGMGTGSPDTPSPVWQTSSDFDYIQGSYIDGYGNITYNVASHHREVLFIKGAQQIFVVVDRLLPNDANEHLYTVIWNLKTTNTSTENALKAVLSQDYNVGNLAVVPLASVSATNVSRHVAENNGNTLWGWDVSRNSPFNIPDTALLHERKAAGIQYFVTLLVPLPPSRSVPSSSVSSTKQTDQFTYSVTFSSGTVLDIKLSQNSTQGGMLVHFGDNAFYSPNYNATSSTPSTTTSSSSSTSSSPLLSTTGTESTGVSMYPSLLLLVLAHKERAQHRNTRRNHCDLQLMIFLEIFNKFFKGNISLNIKPIP